MTNGEAARKLFDIKHDEHFSWTQESVDAFDLAISALFDLAISSLEKHPDESSGTRKRPKWANSIRDALLFPCQSTLEMLPDIPATGAPEECEDAVSRQAAIDALEKCMTCKHVYQRVSDADTLYCRCRKGCRYEEVKPRRIGESPRRHEG